MKKVSKMDAGIIIVILTAFSYGMAYTYQASYKAYYHLPNIFVEINTNTIIQPLITILFIITIALLLWNLILLFSPELKLESFLLIVVMAMGYIGIIQLGKFYASNQEDYIVIREGENLFVAVTSYQDSLIMAPLDIEKESITPKFKAIEIKDLKNAEMIHFENGLKVEDLSNSEDLTK